MVTITTKEGAMANPLVPIMVIGSHEMVVNFGVSQADVREISAGMLAEITVNGNTYSGKVLDIGTLPDETSRTYSTNVSIDVYKRQATGRSCRWTEVGAPRSVCGHTMGLSAAFLWSWIIFYRS